MPTVAIVGMGYVGLTLASLLAMRGYRVHGVEKNLRVVRALNQLKAHLVEPGVEDAIARCIGKNWTVATKHTFSPEVVIVCVSTPVNESGRADLRNLQEAVIALEPVLPDKALIIIRSTVPVGTTRRVVLPLLRRRRLSLAFCPERTIQGQALRELVELPQVIGGLDTESRMSAEAFFSPFAKHLMSVSSLEAAEMVKLVNNCHTDVIYSFGNEVALMAREYQLDPLEVIDAANFDYPRPNLAKPGFVGGACLTKDPYILCSSFNKKRCEPKLILAARGLNERMPHNVAKHLIESIKRTGKKIHGAKVLVCGFAYKGVPETDDMRGAPVIPFLKTLKPSGMRLFGHDYVVPDYVIAGLGVRPTPLTDGVEGVDAIVFLNNHKRYEELDVDALLQRAAKPVIIYDCWRIFRRNPAMSNYNVIYAGIGFNAA